MKSIKKNLKFKKYLFFYLIILFIFGIFFLFTKHQVGNDSTISEWLINYYGGFTKRGIIGQMAVYLANIFELKLRFSIYLLQIFSMGIYYFLILRYFLLILEILNILLIILFKEVSFPVPTT